MKRLQVVLEAGNVALDSEIEADDLLAVGAEDEDVGFADALAEQIDAACRACDRIGHGRIGDQYVVGIGRQIDHDRLVEAELDALTLAVGADLRLVGEGGVAKLRQARGHAQEAGRKGGNADDAAGSLHEIERGRPQNRRRSHGHFPAPTSVTSPDLMRRTVPRRPLPETR